MKLPDDIRSKLKLPFGATWADAMALGQVRAALRGNTVAAREIADRVEGRVPLPMKVETPEYSEIRVTVVPIGGRWEPKNDSREKETDRQISNALKAES